MKVIRQIKSYFVKIRQIVNIWQLKRAGGDISIPPPSSMASCILISINQLL